LHHNLSSLKHDEEVNLELDLSSNLEL